MKEKKPKYTERAFFTTERDQQLVGNFNRKGPAVYIRGPIHSINFGGYWMDALLITQK